MAYVNPATIPPPMSQVSLKLEQLAYWLAGETKTLPVPNGAPCETCGKPSVWILKRRIQSAPSMMAGSTSFDPDSPCHPRCGDHIAPGDAWTIDGLDRKGGKRGKR